MNHSLKRKKIRFIINPVAGASRQKNIIKLIERFALTSNDETEIYHTEYAGHATDLSKEAAQKNYSLVVAAGGDGSVSEAGKGLINTDTALGIIPTGSGNGFANHFKIPHHIPSALQLITSGRVIKADTLIVNNEPCMGLAGIGFDAHIAHQFAIYNKKRGFGTYCKIIVKEFFKYLSADYFLSVNEKTIQRRAFLITFANSSQYGNHAVIAPMADIQDGYMDICILKKVTFINIFGIIFRLFNGTLDKSHAVEFISARTAVLTDNASGIAHIDGEPKALKGNISVSVNPLSLNILVP